MEKTIDVIHDDITAHLVVHSATVRDEIAYSALTARSIETEFEDEFAKTAAIVIYPKCMACLVDGQVNGKNAKMLTMDEFLALPAEIGDAWYQAILECNPRWKPDFSTVPRTETEKKKVTTLGSD